jgi:hypothetical protein
MGLASDLMRGVSGQAGFVELYANICTDMERDQEAWVAALRAAGVKAAHPDDGWVNRKDNYVQSSSTRSSTTAPRLATWWRLVVRSGAAQSRSTASFGWWRFTVARSALGRGSLSRLTSKLRRPP